jgi:hypothetical protein
MRAQDVVPAHDEVGTQVALVPIEEVGGGGDVGADPGLATRVESLQFQVGGHEEVDELGVCGCSGSAGVDVGGDVVDLLTIFLDYDGAASGPGVRSQHHSSVVLDSHDGGSCFFIGKRFYHVFLLQKRVSG